MNNEIKDHNNIDIEKANENIERVIEQFSEALQDVGQKLGNALKPIEEAFRKLAEEVNSNYTKKQMETEINNIYIYEYKVIERRKNMKKYRRFSSEDILGAFIILLVLAVIVGIVADYCVNEGNKITTGVIVDKKYSSFYTKFGRVQSFTITIAGNKSGEYVEYTFTVCETEYEKYKIGDNYQKND